MPRTSKGTRTNAKNKPQSLPVQFRTGFLAELDGRTELSRALRGNYTAIVADIGGPDEVGHVKAAVVERFVWLEAVLQTIEHEMATGKIDKAEALGRWIQAVNSLTGLAKVLGIERRANSRPWIVPTTDNGNGKQGARKQEAGK